MLCKQKYLQMSWERHGKTTARNQAHGERWILDGKLPIFQRDLHLDGQERDSRCWIMTDFPSIPNILAIIINQPGLWTRLSWAARCNGQHAPVVCVLSHAYAGCLQRPKAMIICRATKHNIWVTMDTRWCPSSLAKLVNITPISLEFMADISIDIGIITQPTSLGGHHHWYHGDLVHLPWDVDANLSCAARWWHNALRSTNHDKSIVRARVYHSTDLSFESLQNGGSEGLHDPKRWRDVAKKVTKTAVKTSHPPKWCPKDVEIPNKKRWEIA